MYFHLRVDWIRWFFGPSAAFSLGETFFVDYPMPPDASHAESRATHVGQFGGADEFLEMPKGNGSWPKVVLFFFFCFFRLFPGLVQRVDPPPKGKPKVVVFVVPTRLDVCVMFHLWLPSYGTMCMAQDPQSSAAKWSPKSTKTPLEQGEAWGADGWG